MHPSKVTLRPKVRRPMAWDSTKSAPSAQQPDPSTQCPIPGGYRRAETRQHRIDHPARLREDAQQPDMIAAIHCLAYLLRLPQHAYEVAEWGLPLRARRSDAYLRTRWEAYPIAFPQRGHVHTDESPGAVLVG